MPFLTDAEIDDLIDRGHVQGVDVRGSAATATAPSQVQPCSLDIRIDDIYQPLTSLNSSPSRTNSHELGVGQSVRVSTKEVFDLPADVGAILMAPARITRKGILVPDLGHIDPGFKGPLRLTLINLGRASDSMKSGDVVGTVLFFRLSTDAAVPFCDQPGATQNLEHGISDVKFLSPDFLDFKKRATACAREEAKRVLGVSGFKLYLQWVIPLFLGLGGAYILYAFAVEDRLTKVEAKYEAVVRFAEMEKRIAQLEMKRVEESRIEQVEARTPVEINVPPTQKSKGSEVKK